MARSTIGPSQHLRRAVLMAFALAPILLDIVLVQAHAREDQKAAPPPSLMEIVKAVKDRQSRIESLFVSHTQTAECLVDREGAHKYLHLLYLENVQETFAFKGRKRYHKVEEDKFVEPLVPDPKRPKMPTLGNMEAAFDGKNLRRYMALGDEMDVHAPARDDSDGHWFPQSYLSRIGMKLPEAWNPKPKIDRTMSQLGRLLAEPGARVLPIETVDGAPCAIVSVPYEFRVEGIPRRSFLFRLALDPKLGYVLRSRDSLEPKTGLLIGRLINSDFIEVARNIWLPKTSVAEQYGDSGMPKKYQGKPMVRFTIKVSKLSINDVPDSLFTLGTRPGMRVVDKTVGTDADPKAIMYRMPADPAKVDTVVKKELERTNEAGRDWTFIIALNVVTLALIVGCVIGYRSWQRRRQARA